MKKYARSVSKKGNIALDVYYASYSQEGSSLYKTPEDTTRPSKKVMSDIKKLLSLKTEGYKDYTLAEFLDYICGRYEEDNSIWKARQRLHLSEEIKKYLPKEDYEFLTITIICTEGESTNPHDRTGNIPPGFQGMYELPYPKHATTHMLEWCVQYEIKNPDMTVGQRDKLVLNVKNGMDGFIEETSATNDIASKKYLKKVRRRLKQLINENNGHGLEMKVFFCR